MKIDRVAQLKSITTVPCVDCEVTWGTPRIDIHARCAVTICDACCDRRAVQCPFCGSPFGREVKRASRCKKCGEMVARNSRSPLLASRLATPAICGALEACGSVNAPPPEQAWLLASLFACLLEAAQAGGNSHAVDTAFAASLRTHFERGLTQDRLSLFGFGFARAIWLCGGNPRPIQRTLHRSELKALGLSRIVVSVEVLFTQDSCKNCMTLSGKVWTLAAALEENPLPCRDCLESNAGGYGWCRCCYQPRLSSDYEDIAQELTAAVEAQTIQTQQDLIAADLAAAVAARNLTRM